jgi:hypothetical protein
MKLLGQRDLGSHAWPFSGDMRRIRLRIGAFEFLLTQNEAVDLARKLVEAVDRSKAADDG